jgi:hypothetical protein
VRNISQYEAVNEVEDEDYGEETGENFSAYKPRSHIGGGQ